MAGLGPAGRAKAWLDKARKESHGVTRGSLCF